MVSNKPMEQWEANGFATATKSYTAEGTERILRCYSAGFQNVLGVWRGSQQLGVFFWVFRTGSDTDPIKNVTINQRVMNADFLERNLNAALFENTYQTAGEFMLRRGTQYCIGPIGQTTRGSQKQAAGVGHKWVKDAEKKINMLWKESKDFTGSAKSLLQVFLPIPNDVKDNNKYLREVVQLVAEYDIKGRDRYTHPGSNHARH